MPVRLKPFATSAVDLLVVVCLSLAGVRPALGPALPCSDDVAFHLLRLVQLDWLLTNGTWFSRWAPNMAGGYGLPLFNYYAPLSYYGAEAISLLTGDLYRGLQWTFAAGFILSGLAMFWLARLYLGRPAAYTAAAAYLYAPYQGYDIHFRGNLAESFAWWLLPLALWAMIRLVRTGSWRWVGWSALTYALVLLTHNAFALIFSPLLAGWALWAWWFEQDKGPTQPAPSKLIKIGAALGLGLLLAAFFWFPALTERDLIHTDRLLVPPVFVYWGNFVTLGELLAWPQTVHPDLLNPSIPRAVGAITALLALPALGWLWPTGLSIKTSSGSAARTITPFLLLTFLFLLFLMLPASRPIWDTVPLLEFIQFPWRLLGAAALVAALLVGLAVKWLGRWPWGRWMPLVAIPLLTLGSLFWFSPHYCAGLENATVEDIVPFEQATQTIGTTAKGEYQPRTSAALPAEPFATPFTLPAGVDLRLHTWTPLAFRAEIEAAAPAVVTANQLFFPGWQAAVNSRRVDMTPSRPEGLITFEVPAGPSTIEVRFGETPRRLAVDLLSLAALVVAAGLIWFGGPIERAVRRPARSSTSDTGPGTPGTYSGLWSLVSGLLGIFLWALVTLLPSLNTPLYRPWLPTQAGQTPMAVYEDGLVVHQVRLAAREMPADGSLPVDLWLSAGRPLGRNLQTRVQLVDAAGAIWSPAETVWPRIYRPYYDTVTWPVGEYARELLLAAGISGIPPGLYTVELVVFDRETRQPLRTTDGRPALPLGTVQLTRPERPFEPAGHSFYTADEGQFKELQLLASSVDRREAAVGDPFTVTAFWGLNTPVAADYVVDLAIFGDGLNPLWQQTFPLVRADWPVSRWQPGDAWRGRYVARFPADLPAGTYRWGICARPVEQKCSRDLLIIGPITLSAPERLFDEPAMASEQRLEQPFGDLATLIGFNGRHCPGLAAGRCDIQLVWRAERSTATSYRVFLQLLGPDGQVVAQSDGEPAGWSRPTTSWIAGEYIVDQRSFSWDSGALPPGEYQLVTGLYDPDSGRRLLTLARKDAVLLKVLASIDQ